MDDFERPTNRPATIEERAFDAKLEEVIGTINPENAHDRVCEYMRGPAPAELKALMHEWYASRVRRKAQDEADEILANAEEDIEIANPQSLMAMFFDR